MSDIPVTGILEEAPGVKSSKRLAGFVLAGAGAALLIAVGIVAMFRQLPMPNAQLTIAAGTTLLGVGGALLGVTVLEGLGAKVGGDR